MQNKTIYIGLGILALAGAGYWYIKNNPAKPKVNNMGQNCPNANEVKDASGNCVKTGGVRGGVQGDTTQNVNTTPSTSQQQALENWLHPKCAADEHLEDIVAPCFVAPCTSIPTCVKNKAGLTGIKKKNYVNSSFFNTPKDYAYGKPS